MKKRLLPIIAVVVSLGAAAFTLPGAQSQELTPGQKLSQTVRIIEDYYVTDFDTTKMTDEAIRAMLLTLDPHSTYTTAEETRELNEPLQGSFSGIGIQYNMLNDTLVVIQTIAGGPSEQVGLRAGDRILTANDSIISGGKRKNSEIQRILRGPKGTTVDLVVQRPGTSRNIDFRITRADIPIFSVDAAFMVDPTTGYIRITRFAEDTPEEVAEAMQRLMAQGMKDIIIDLQDNGGGYLGSATKLAEMFLPIGSLIVYTEGDRVRTSSYRSLSRPSFPVDGRVVVLVNQYSASASEILAGALQDNDRGVIIGRRTFGKGLVQRPFPFPDGSMIRLTVSRYYTPSGRCIQKPYTSGDDEEYSEDMSNRYNSGELFSADSIHFNTDATYYTRNSHRIMRGGGGIMPDRFVPLDTTEMSGYYRDLRGKGIFNRFALRYLDDNRTDLLRRYPDAAKFNSGFDIDEPLMDRFVQYAKEEGVEPDADGLAQSRRLIAGLLKGIIARDLYDMEAYYRVINTLDPIFLDAMELLNAPREEYDAILFPNY